jgi:hypothetical protein
LTTDAASYVYEDRVERQALLANYKAWAVDQALELYARFGWTPSRALIEEEQSELRWLSK